MPIVFDMGMLVFVIALFTAVPIIVFQTTPTESRGRRILLIIIIDALAVAGLGAILSAMYTPRIVGIGHAAMAGSVLAFVFVLTIIGKANLKTSVIFGIILMLLTTGVAYESVVVQAEGFASVADADCRSRLRDIGLAIQEYYQDKNIMPPRDKWKEALKPYLEQFHYKDILTAGHSAGDGPRVTEAKYLYTGNSIDSPTDRPLVYCHHPQYFATPPRTIMLLTDLKVTVTRDK